MWRVFSDKVNDQSSRLLPNSSIGNMCMRFSETMSSTFAEALHTSQGNILFISFKTM